MLSESVQTLRNDHVNVARERFKSAIRRDNDCALRGQPDAGGQGRDGFNDRGAQLGLHSDRLAALNALAP